LQVLIANERHDRLDKITALVEALGHDMAQPSTSRSYEHGPQPPATGPSLSSCPPADSRVTTPASVELVKNVTYWTHAIPFRSKRRGGSSTSSSLRRMSWGSANPFEGGARCRGVGVRPQCPCASPTLQRFSHGTT
jgi:hypothetical protein